MHRALPRILAAATACAVLVTAVRAETVYFVSRANGGLYSFDTSGTAITTVKEPNTFSQPAALAFGPDGNLYIGDATAGGRIARYEFSGGNVSTVVALSGTDPAFSGGPVSPAAIAFRPTGQMLVGRNPEAIFTGAPAGPVLQVSGWEVGGTATVQDYTSGTTQTYSPGLAVAADGTLYASNSLYGVETFLLTGNVLKFGPGGTFQAEVAADGSGSGGLFGPTGLALAGNSLYIASVMDGIVYETDLTNPDTATNTTVFGITNGDNIGPLATLANGNVLAGAVATTGLIYQFDPSGELVGSPFGGGSYGAIGGLAVAPVPEPSTVVIGLTGVAVLVNLVRRRGAARP